jgi:hypothetical protein
MSVLEMQINQQVYPKGASQSFHSTATGEELVYPKASHRRQLDEFISYGSRVSTTTRGWLYICQHTDRIHLITSYEIATVFLFYSDIVLEKNTLRPSLDQYALKAHQFQVHFLK